jgi:hypothetical protein
MGEKIVAALEARFAEDRDGKENSGFRSRRP